MKDKKNILIIALTVFLMGVGLPAVSSAVDVFAECAYTDVDVECYIYANTDTEELRSGGVKLIYATDQFETDPAPTATATKNTTDWYFGDPTGTTYDYPNSPDTNTAGEAVIIVGKMDTRTGPPDLTGVGVSGTRVLMGTVKLIRTGTDPALFGLDLALGIDDGVVPPNEGYVNFVNTLGTDLDNGGVTFNINVLERGDANGSGGITPSDINAVKGNIGNPDAPVWVDCNANGSVGPSDINCVKGKI